MKQYSNIIAERIEKISATLPQGVTLIAVSKYHPVEAVAAAYAAGQRHFGESKAQDLVKKHEALPADICWHFIGHLQSNKIKYIAPFIHMIHSIDSLRLLQEVNKQSAKVGRKIPCLLQEVNKQSAKVGRKIPCLLQIHIAQEETKFGFTPQECIDMLAAGEWRALENVEIRGLMCMASNTDDEQQIRAEFAAVNRLFHTIKERFFAENEQFSILSAGMSDDYPIAIEEGSNHVRVGSAIFAME